MRPLLLLALIGCAPDPDNGTTNALDLDGDGFTTRLDCDDSDATVGGPLTRYTDSDSDGYGTDEITDCDPDIGALVSGDCDNTNPAIHPGADELCNGIDDNCDGSIDWGTSDIQTIFVDWDEDGFGDATLGPIYSCDLPQGFADNDGDCNDNNADIRPDQTEVCGDGIDQNCDLDDCILTLPSIVTQLRSDTDERGVFITGTGASGRFGSTVVNAGDVNGDGQDDLWVTAPGVGDQSPGQLYLFLGGQLPPSGTANERAYAIIRSWGSNRIGSSIAPIGDIDEDGYDDLLIGMNSIGFGNVGRGVIILRGPVPPNPSNIDDVASWHRSGLAQNRFGEAVSALGDINGDGRNDFAIGAPGTSAGNGHIQIYTDLLDADLPGFGTPTHVLTGQPGEELGAHPLLDAGDLNGDGLDDLLIPSVNTNRLFVVLSDRFPTGGLTVAETAIQLTLPGASPIDEYQLGSMLAHFPDIDGDGLPEFLIGAPGWQGAGAIFLLYSNQDWAALADQAGAINLSQLANLTIIGGRTGDAFGAFAAAGDIDGDGLFGLIASGPRASNPPGETPVYHRGATVIFRGDLPQGVQTIGAGFSADTLTWGPTDTNTRIGPVAYIPAERGGTAVIGAPFLDSANLLSEVGGIAILYGNTSQ